jgi:hypothetical protein
MTTLLRADLRRGCSRPRIELNAKGFSVFAQRLKADATILQRSLHMQRSGMREWKGASTEISFFLIWRD